MSSIVPWTSPGNPPCCCVPPCQSDIIGGWTNYIRADISQQQATLLRQGALIYYSFNIEIEGETPAGNSTMSGSLSRSGTTTLSVNNGCAGSIDIATNIFQPFLLQVQSGGTINVDWRNRVAIYLQQEGGGWPNTQDTTSNLDPALFIAGDGYANWGGIPWGWNWYYDETGTPSGTFFDDNARAVFSPTASFNNAGIKSFDFSLSFGAP